VSKPIQPPYGLETGRLEFLLRDNQYVTAVSNRKKAAVNTLRECTGEPRHTAWRASPLLRLGFPHRIKRARLLQLQLRRARCLPGPDWRFYSFWPRCPDFNPHAPLACRTSSPTVVRQTDLDWLGCLGRRRGTHSTRCTNWLAHGDRCRKHRHQGHTRRYVCGWKSMPRDPRHQSGESSYGKADILRSNVGIWRNLRFTASMPLHSGSR
jgi:hypothetical protein